MAAARIVPDANRFSKITTLYPFKDGNWRKRLTTITRPNTQQRPMHFWTAVISAKATSISCSFFSKKKKKKKKKKKLKFFKKKKKKKKK